MCSATSRLRLVTSPTRSPAWVEAVVVGEGAAVAGIPAPRHCRLYPYSSSSRRRAIGAMALFERAGNALAGLWKYAVDVEWDEVRLHGVQES